MRRRADRGRRRPDPTDLDRVGAMVEQVAALLEAGVSPPAVWQNVAASKADADAMARAARAAQRGESVSEALATAPSVGWSLVAAAWSAAEQLGVPLAKTLRSIARSIGDEAQLRREVAAALAGPVASARLIAVLPGVAILFGMVFGFHTLTVLVTNPLGWVCLAVGSVLFVGGALWNTDLVRRAMRGDRLAVGLESELQAVALSSGASLDRAHAAISGALARYVPGSAGGIAIGDVAARAAAAGAPVADLLRSEAARLRRQARNDGLVAAARLGVRLNIPLGLCVLPAFVLLGIIPLLLSVVTTTLQHG